MNRRRAIAIAGAVTATTAGGALAIAANVGLLGFARSEPSTIGALRADDPIELVVEEQATTTTAAPSPAAVDLPPEVVVQYEDVYVQDPAPAARPEMAADVPAAAVVTPPLTAAPSTTVASGPEPEELAADDGEGYDDDQHEDDEYEYEHDEYEHDGEQDDD